MEKILNKRTFNKNEIIIICYSVKKFLDVSHELLKEMEEMLAEGNELLHS